MGQKIKEGLRVNSDIITQDLCDAIRNILKQPIEAFCQGSLSTLMKWSSVRPLVANGFKST